MLILSIDPGLTTGWSLVDYKYGTFFKVDGGWLLQTEKTYEFVNVAQRLLDRPNIDVLVIEDFILLPYAARDVALHDAKLLTCKLIGALAALAPCPVVYQRASEKQACSDEELRRLGLWQRSGPREKKHMHDALRHAVVYIRKGNNVKNNPSG